MVVSTSRFSEERNRVPDRAPDVWVNAGCMPWMQCLTVSMVSLQSGMTCLPVFPLKRWIRCREMLVLCMLSVEILETCVLSVQSSLTSV